MLYSQHFIVANLQYIEQLKQQHSKYSQINQLYL